MGLGALRTHLLECAVSGHCTHVSTRETLHRYYRMGQEGLAVKSLLQAAGPPEQFSCLLKGRGVTRSL